MGSMVVPFCGSYLGSYSVFPKGTTMKPRVSCLFCSSGLSAPSLFGVPCAFPTLRRGGSRVKEYTLNYE